MVTGYSTEPPPGLPPGPWRWERIDPGALARRRQPGADRGDDHATRADAGPRGWGLVGADGTPVLLHDAGWGTPDLGQDLGFRPDHPVAALLARASEIPRLEGALADAQARDAALTAAHREAVTWARLLADTFGVPPLTGLGPPPEWLLGTPEQP